MTQPTGIIVAMEKELMLLLPLLHDAATVNEQGITFHVGTIASRPVVVAKCGIGKVNAALTADTLIRRFSPSLLINSGVAGGMAPGQKVMDVVVGDRVAYHDVWCGPGTVWGQIDGFPLYFEGHAPTAALPCLQGPDVHHGLICSGDRFVDSGDDAELIRSRFPQVAAVDMESAPIAHTCALRSVPFLSIRVLSDTPGDHPQNTLQYENFWAIAPQRTFKILTDLLKAL